MEVNSKNTIAVVLTGGKSTRMGQDKGLLIGAQTKKTWAKRQYDLLLQLNISVYISIHLEQKKKYQKIFDENKLIIDSVDVKGPLTGILSVSQKFPDNHILVLPCDMQNIQKQTVQLLLENFENKLDVILFENNGLLEPLLAIYNKNYLRKLLIKVKNSKRNNEHLKKRFSLKHYLSHANIKTIPITNSLEFINMNFKEDIMQ